VSDGRQPKYDGGGTSRRQGVHAGATTWREEGFRRTKGGRHLVPQDRAVRRGRRHAARRNPRGTSGRADRLRMRRDPRWSRGHIDQWAPRPPSTVEGQTTLRGYVSSKDQTASRGTGSNVDGQWREVWCDEKNCALHGTSVGTWIFGERGGERGHLARRVAHPGPIVLASPPVRCGPRALTVRRFENRHGPGARP